jgi:bifunctional non-homologous end joining protein LigD
MEFEPMLASTGEGQLSALAGTHVFDTKLDGVRMLALWDGSTLTLRNRNARDCTVSWPDLVLDAPNAISKPMVLDGEVIIPNHAFQDVARRNQATKVRVAAAMAARMPAAFIAFDILSHDGVDVRDQPLSWRRQLLELHVEETQHWGKTLCSTDPVIYDLVRDGGGEGVIAKRLTSRYVPGRSRNWLKFKATTSVTCVGVGYEPGSGSRAAFGAMRLAMVDSAGGVHIVGRVGSGFKDREVASMKATFDNARSGEDLPVVEVECLGLTREGVLRQPVYKGLRTDLTRFDANITQLEGLTRS